MNLPPLPTQIFHHSNQRFWDFVFFITKKIAFLFLPTKKHTTLNIKTFIKYNRAGELSIGKVHYKSCNNWGGMNSFEKISSMMNVFLICFSFLNKLRSWQSYSTCLKQFLKYVLLDWSSNDMQLMRSKQKTLSCTFNHHALCTTQRDL